MSLNAFLLNQPVWSLGEGQAPEELDKPIETPPLSILLIEKPQSATVSVGELTITCTCFSNRRRQLTGGSHLDIASRFCGRHKLADLQPHFSADSQNNLLRRFLLLKVETSASLPKWRPKISSANQLSNGLKENGWIWPARPGSTYS